MTSMLKKVMSTPKMAEPEEFNPDHNSYVDGALQWDISNYSVTNVQGATINVLTKVTGALKQGKLTAVMGPSGAGKTSLVNLMSGRTAGGTNKTLDATFKLHGRTVKPMEVRNRFAYVMQHDALFATQTPREAIEFSAKLRGIPNPQEAAVRVIRELKLESCADTLNGNEMIKGISGGEKKRTSIGFELVGQPDVIFLDEPTSGLDSYSAVTVIDTLKELCTQGKTVLATIHQPSSDLFFTFDEVIFLAKGKVFYQGPVKAIATHFDVLSKELNKEHLRCPEGYNIADHVLYLIQTSSAEEIDEICGQVQNIDKNIAQFMADNDDGEVVQVKQAKDEKPINRTRPGIFGQFLPILAREAKDVYRDKATLGARIGITVFIALISGAIFYQAGDLSKTETRTINGIDMEVPDYSTVAHFGGLCMTAISCMFGNAQPVLLTFPLQAAVFAREYASGLYGTPAYVAARTMVDIPLTIAQTGLVRLSFSLIECKFKRELILIQFVCLFVNVDLFFCHFLFPVVAHPFCFQFQKSITVII